MPRSLSDIGLSTATNDAPASALFSAQKNPQRIPANTPPVFLGLRPRICQRLLRLVTNGNVGQAPSLSTVFSRLRILTALTLLCQVALFSQACSTSAPSTGQQHRAPQATVYFEEVADWSFEAAHPAVIGTGAISQVLRGIHVGDGSSHTSSADGSKPMRAFSDEDVEYLAPLLAHALSQAQPEYVVAFRLSSSAGSGLEPTAGTLYVKDEEVYVTLTAYQGNLNKTASPMFGESPAARSVSFSPESAAHAKKADPTVALGQRDLITLAIDYNLLDNPSAQAPMEPPAPVAAKPETKNPERFLMASAASDTSTRTGMAASPEPEAVSRADQEFKDAQRTIARKDAKIDQLRRDLESMRQQLEAKDKELRRVKSKPAPIKREKRGKAELAIR